MKKNSFQEMTTEELLKKQKLVKGVLLGFGLLYLMVVAVFIYLLLSQGIKRLSVPTLVPVFLFPVMLLPLTINLSLLNKEMASRKM